MTVKGQAKTAWRRLVVHWQTVGVRQRMVYGFVAAVIVGSVVTSCLS